MQRPNRDTLLPYDRTHLTQVSPKSFVASLHGDRTEAEGCFQRALDVAGCQSAKCLELRAATSLARLWRDRGNRRESRDLLAPIYGWFTEGFDTLDLKQAKSLLDELAQ